MPEHAAPPLVASTLVAQTLVAGVPEPTETIHVDTPVVACDGGNSALGHPRVWLRIVSSQVLCPYCSRLYVLNAGADHGSGH